MHHMAYIAYIHVYGCNRNFPIKLNIIRSNRKLDNKCNKMVLIKYNVNI